MSILNIQNLSFSRQHQTVISQLSLSLNSGEVMIVQGENGSGKTTLLKLIAGLLKPTEGVIEWHTESQNTQNDIAWVGHSTPLKPELSGLENLEFLTTLRAVSNLSPIEAIKQVGLAKSALEPVKIYSAGMKRRLLLASLLTSKAKVWVLDEPQSALDRQGVALFHQIAEEHLSNDGVIIMTSHLDVHFDEQFVQKHCVLEAA